MPAKRCPTSDELKTYAYGTLAVELADEVTKHLADCESCEDTVQQLSAASVDRMRDLVNAQSVPQPYVEEPACGQAVESIKRSAPPAGAGSHERSAPEGKPAEGKAAAHLDRAAFVEFLTQAGFVATADIASIEKQLPAEKRNDVPALAQALIQLGKLTKFQAATVYQGHGKSLNYGDYLVLDRIGSGGMGQVYKARHRRLDRIVALKVLSPTAMRNTDSVKRFEREARAAAKLVHPNIVHTYDAGAHDDTHYLVMEYVAGTDMSSLIKKQGKLPLAQGCDFIAQAARGLAYAHAQGIVHRDVKPSNLLVDPAGAVKVLDMGLARFDAEVGAASTERELTQTGAVMGTIDYMAPEQALNTSRADAKSDVYSLGCTLYRILTGTNAFGGETMVEKILAHRELPIPPLRKTRPDAPPALEAFLGRMMAKKPDDRPTMQQVAETLATILKAEPNPTPSLPQAVQPTGARAPSASGPVPNVAARALQTKGAAPPKRRSPLILVGAAGAAGVLILAGVLFVIRDKDGNKLAEVNAPDGSSVAVHVEPSGTGPNLVASPTATQASAAPKATLTPVVAPQRAATEPMPVTVAKAPEVPQEIATPTAPPATPTPTPVTTPVTVASTPAPAAEAGANRSAATEPLVFEFVPLAQEVLAGVNPTVQMLVRNATSREFPLTGTYHHSDMAAFRHVAAYQVRLQCLDPGPTAFAGFTDLKSPATAAGVIIGNPRISSTKTVLAAGEELTASLPLKFFNTLPVGRYALTMMCVPQRGLGRVQYASYEFRIVAQPPETITPALVAWSFTPPAVVATVPKLLPIADPERRATVWALALGAKVQILINGVPSDPRNMPESGPFFVRSIDFFECGNHNEGRRMITDAEVANLAGLKEINHLRLPHTQITDIGLKEIGTLTSLRALDLTEAKITDAGLPKLAPLNEVTSLRLSGTLITNAGVSRIVRLFPKVSEPLDLNDTNVSDAGIAHLKDAGFLRYVGLNGTDVGDRGVAQLAAIPRVAGVQLIGSRLTAAGVAQLKAAAAQRDRTIDIGWDPTKVKTGPMVAVAVTAPAAVPLAVPAATPSATPTSSAAKTSTPATAPAPEPMPSPVATRARVPDTKAQQTALQLIKEVYKDDYTTAKTPEKKTELADKLLEQAQQTAEATERYVLLNEARTFAVDGDNQGLLLRILAATAEVYEVDAVTLHIDTWKAVLAKPRPAAMVREIYDEAGNRLEAAVARGAFDDAKRFGDYALSIAPRIGDATAVKATRDRNTSLAARQLEWTTASNALITLSKSPDDDAANLIVGRYRALVEEDWPSAFPLLAKGSDESWKELAGKSTTVGEDGTTRAALADSFWDASKSKPALKAELNAAALYWYQAALPALNGLQKVRVEKRIAEVTVLVPPRKLPPTPLTAATTP
jgi:serine/threonine protein kinase